MAITDKKTGPWGLDQVFNKINQGSIWTYSGAKQLWSWGYNQNGKLGQNNLTAYSSPVQIHGGGTWDGLVSSGSEHTLATKSDGTLWAYGRNNSSGNLGLNDRTDRSSPTQIPGTTWPITNDSELSCSGSISLAIKTDGTLWSWGGNYRGGLGAPGIGGDDDRSSPVQIPGATWKGVCTGGFGQLAVKTNGTMWSWGSNVYGVLGTNQTGGAWPNYDAAQKYSSPVQIPGTTWNKIPQGVAYSRYATKTDGTLWSWGYNAGGMLGQNNTTNYSSPTQIPGTTWDKLYTGKGGTNFASIKTDGTLWVMGRNSSGVLGQNQASAQLTATSSPVQIPGTWDKISIGSNMSMGIKTDGTSWVWGHNNYGTLGQNNRTYYSSPTQIPGDWLKMSIGGGPMAIKNA